MKWFRLSAEQGNVSAQTNLSLSYFDGKGVPQDHKTSLYWYKLAAVQFVETMQQNPTQNSRYMFL